MPKDKRSGQSAPQKNRSRPYKARGKGFEGDSTNEKEDWIDALCPICLESPHNAVLLMCSSHADGCRPYMCNTSHRHSNCLDQYQKTQAVLQRSHALRHPVSDEEHIEHSTIGSLHADESLNVRLVGDTDMENMIIEALNSRIASVDSGVPSRRSRRNSHLPLLTRNDIDDDNDDDDEEDDDDDGTPYLDLDATIEVDALEGSSEEHGTGASLKSKHLTCPLCRGQIYGWRVINAARKHLNDKARSCSHESCTFAGTYQELRVHARCEHPFTRPCDIDPARQRDWLRMERQREMGDVLSTIGGAAGEDMNSDNGQWWSYLFLLQFFGSTVPVVYEGRLRDHQQGPPLRAGSARLREIVENMSRVTDGLNTPSSEIRPNGEQSNQNLGQLRRQLRPRGS
ncbi:hypothetical protein KP509_11G052400 [Ceratopteris richardii]|uniref:Zinc finger, RING/FYVE/PHD-type n=1 Tax=Ceratopteris richardii TaxID=49495 RepID=A0A8T2TRJ3_CERRI|nr:hypothetical protein KP509_11G052400 [Ceratopteris richardii]KAH7425403.1 hypothetical protein KP509_11G052400 [Ceratopteris richardii]